MNNKIHLIRLCIAWLTGILFIFAFTNIFYRIPIFDIQPIALIARLLTDASLTVLILALGLGIFTLIFGRIFCATLCPLGLVQDLVLLGKRFKGRFYKNQPYKYFLAALVYGTLIGGSVTVIRLIDPYTLAGNAITGGVIGLIGISLIVILTFFKGRFFCAHICPAGTILGLLSRNSFLQIRMNPETCITCGLCARHCPTGSIDFKKKHVNNETCIKCFKCLHICPKNSLCYSHCRSHPFVDVPFDPTRRRLLIGAGAAALLVLTAKSSFKWIKNRQQKLKKMILPAGAISEEEFKNRCLNCNLCVQNCPMKILKKASSAYSAVHIEYAGHFCDYTCKRCSDICPSGALHKMTLAKKQRTQIGVAVIDENICVKCGLCVTKCPRGIIHKERGAFPTIHPEKCIGCGVCQSVCPVQAITIIGTSHQRLL